MNTIIKVLTLVITILVLMSLAFGAGIALGGSGLLFESGVVQAADQPVEFGVFWQAWGIVQKNFIDKPALDATKMTYGAIRGMLLALGDEGHTTFMTPEELERQRTEISGSFFGIGARLDMKDGFPMIVAPFDGSPAAKAGVKAGDLIMQVNGEDVTSWSLNEVVDHIRGEKGTTVILTLFRPDENKSLEISIIRDEIKVPTVTWAMLPGTKVAMIRLSQFSANATEEMMKAITEAKTAGATSLVVDLRSNPGGLLEQAVDVTSQFLKDGNVLQQENADASRTPYPVKAGGLATDIPMVVLINRGSASSSEIFAGAIQDHKRGKLVGEKTFGTGTVLEPFMLSDGSGIMLGTSQWLTSDGRLIRKKGIEPDEKVELPIGTAFIYPELVKDLTVDKLIKSEDKQLLKALELLGVTPSN